MYLKSKKLLLYAVTALFMAAIAAFPEKAIIYAKNGILIWYGNVLPVMLPFLSAALFSHEIGFSEFISKIFAKPFEKLFGINGCGTFPLICAILSGYPAGAKLTASLIKENKISLNEGKKLLALCDVTSPSFIVGTVGAGMFGDKKIGIVILLCHYISAVMLCLLIKTPKSTQIHRRKGIYKTPASAMANAVASASQTIISICCFITVFSVIIGFTKDTGLLPSAVMGKENILLDGIFVSIAELTNGCQILSKSRSLFNICAVCAAVSFGGMCIYFQILSVLSDCGIKSRYVFFIKLIHSVLSVFVFLIFAAVGIIT